MAAATATTIMYIGETFRNTTNTIIIKGINAVTIPIFAFLHNENTGIAIRATTIGRIPLNILPMILLSLN